LKLFDSFFLMPDQRVDFFRSFFFQIGDKILMLVFKRGNLVLVRFNYLFFFLIELLLNLFLEMIR